MLNLKDANKLHGGKAYGLSNLLRVDINVPRGVVLSSDDLDNLKNKDEKIIVDIREFLKLFKCSEKFAVRSSAVGEDSDENSFAGMFDTVLNVRNNLEDVLNAINKVANSVQNNRVKEYSGSNNPKKMNVIIQLMIEPSISGVAFTRAIDTNGEDVILIEAVKGLGESLVSGKETASRIIVAKDSRRTDVKFFGNPLDISCINKLVEGIRKINNFFNKEMDIEWCIDNDGKIYFLQARPITRFPILDDIETEGIIASKGIAKGKAFILDEDEDIHKQIASFPKGGILIANYTDVDYVPMIKKASGLIVADGSLLSHSAIVSRELGIPCISGIKDVKNIFKDGGEVFLDAENGIIKQGDIEITLSIKRNFSFKSLVDFEGISEINFEGIRILVKPTIDGVWVNIPPDIDNDKMDKINIFLRKYLKQKTIISTDYDAYLWHLEYERIKNFSFFKELLSRAKIVSRNLDGSSLKKLYEDSVNRVRSCLENKEKDLSYNNILYDEIIMAYHLALDQMIPNGIVAKETYFKLIPVLDKYGLQFDDLFSKNFDRNSYEEEDYKLFLKAQEFFKVAQDLRNSIYTKFIEIGAMSYDFFDIRTENMRSFINLDKGISLGENYSPEEEFYQYYNVTNDVEKLL
ncbi:MAG: PEP/pyruvate-binding domain-containing protein [Bdellovibrionota bacterium]|nr:PEP/pyruvate-binding domain-containing protein [Pseudomonadota bacterium]MDY6091475.1 PEP/pyruvate-binding domain-containing protein [Bdellovibrionota bacterium]